MDNAKFQGRFFIFKGLPLSRWPVTVTILHEVDPPWRHGLGFGFRWKGLMRAAGIWWSGEQPKIDIEQGADIPRDISPVDLLRRD